MGHSLNSPSSFSRRIGCPGSARMEKDLPNKSSFYAAEGTAAHELGETCLLEDRRPEEFLGTEITNDDGQSFKVDADMIDAVNVYVDYCSQYLGEHLVEYKFDLTFLGDDEKGTSDFTAIHDRVLHVIDYKHGRGVPVEAKNNIQGLCYGLGASDYFKNADWDVLRITIVQPRAYHEDGPIRTWDVPRDELFDYMMDFAHYAAETEKPDAPLNTGDWCFFCKAKPICPQQLKDAQEIMEMDFSDESSKPIPIEYLSDEQIADLVLNKIKIIEKWCSSIKDHAQNRAEEGSPLPGTKLVATRAMRMWIDKVKAEKALESKYGDKIYQKKFVSAPQLEKIIGKEEFKEISFLVDKKSTGVTLVAESDKRPNARPSAVDDFA